MQYLSYSTKEKKKLLVIKKRKIKINASIKTNKVHYQLSTNLILAQPIKMPKLLAQTQSLKFESWSYTLCV
jgi:hypothetical protein